MDTKTISAKEARRVAEKFIWDRDMKQYHTILFTVGKVSATGGFDIPVYDEMSAQVKDWILKEGFEISDVEHGRNGEVTYKITW